ncbi:hypothetical protein STEG23_018494, partial [Scotinomys teguina]
YFTDGIDVLLVLRWTGFQLSTFLCSRALAVGKAEAGAIFKAQQHAALYREECAVSPTVGLYDLVLPFNYNGNRHMICGASEASLANNPQEVAHSSRKIVNLLTLIQEIHFIFATMDAETHNWSIAKNSWTLVQLPVLDFRINLHPSLDKGLMTTGDPVSWAPERTTQESSGPSPPDYSSVIPRAANLQWNIVLEKAAPCSGWLFQLSLEVPPPTDVSYDCHALRTESRMCRLSWFLDPGGWSKTTAVGLYFIFPGSRNQESLHIRLSVLKAAVLVPPQGHDSHRKHQWGQYFQAKLEEPPTTAPLSPNN